MPPVPATPASTPVERTAADDARAVPADKRTMQERQIVKAEDLEQRRGNLMKEIGANREFLRNMATVGELTEDQMDWLEDYYPTKERGERRDAEEVARTREVKAAARSRK